MPRWSRHLAGGTTPPATPAAEDTTMTTTTTDRFANLTETMQDTLIQLIVDRLIGHRQDIHQGAGDALIRRGLAHHHAPRTRVTQDGLDLFDADPWLRSLVIAQMHRVREDADRTARRLSTQADIAQDRSASALRALADLGVV